MKTKSECHGCKDRHQGCHAECEKYLKYRQERDEEIKKRYEQTQIDWLFRRGKK